MAADASGAAGSAPFSFTCACGSSVRISKIEMTGRKRMNRNSSVRNRPIEPTKVA